MSNLPFLSKDIGKSVAFRLNSYMDANGLNEKYQSAYKQLHSTEIALVSVADDIVVSLRRKQSC